LFVAFETVGLYRLRRVSSLPALVDVGKDQLIEPVKTFGVTYHAILDDGEFECQYAPEDPAQPGDVVAIGSDANAGEFLEADLEGLSIISSVPGQTFDARLEPGRLELPLLSDWKERAASWFVPR